MRTLSALVAVVLLAALAWRLLVPDPVAPGRSTGVAGSGDLGPWLSREARDGGAGEPSAGPGATPSAPGGDQRPAPVAVPDPATPPAPLFEPPPIAAPVVEAVAPPAAAADATGPVPALSLAIPVAGVEPDALVDTFSESRAGGRSHEAIDIMAPVGTPVLAVADGTVAKLFDSQAGGLTLYQFDATGALAYYYAHLDGYAPGVAEGLPVRQGDLLGFVGHTGNAHADAPHLHFAIFVLGPERNWWQGRAINPYPYLRPSGP